MALSNNNPKGIGGYAPGQTGNPGGRPRVNSKLQIWFLARAREAGEIVVEIANKKDATKSDAVRLAACREILDRGMGKAPQSLSLSLETALEKAMRGAASLEELEAVAEQLRALDSAAPALIDHIIEKEEQGVLPGLGDDERATNGTVSSGAATEAESEG
jgi:hypothetical protein